MTDMDLFNRKRGAVWLFILFFIFPGLIIGQQKMTLQQCRDIALKQNKKIQIAAENAMAVDELEKSARTLYFPNIKFNGGYFRMNKQFSLFSENMFLPVVPGKVYEEGLSALDPRENPDLVRQTLVTREINGIPLPVEDPETGDPLFQKYAFLPKSEAKFNLENVFFGNLSLRQPVYMGGKIKQANKIAKYGKQMMQAKKQVSESDVIVETDERYWKVISLKEKVSLSEKYLGRLNALHTDVKNLHQEGIITRNKVMQVQVNKNKVELQLMKAKNGLSLARMALNETLGLPLDTTIHLSDSLGNATRLTNSQAYKNQALEKRPEIHALNKGVKMAESGEELLKSRYLPNVGVAANYTFTNPNPWNGFEGEFGGSPNVGVFINIPIYHWGERKHTLQAARHKKRAGIKKLEQSRELISLEVKKAIFSYKESIKKIEMTKSSLKQAKENLETTKDNFEEGMAKSTDVLEAQSMWQEAYSDHIDAMTEYKLNRTKLLKASGQLIEDVKNKTTSK